MPEITIQLAGPHATHRATQLSAQVLQNMYLEQNPDPGMPPVCLAFPGKKLFSTGGGSDRGMHVMAEVLYKVSGTTLESISSGGVRTTCGSIPGTNRVSFADDGGNLYAVTGGVIYKWDGSSVSTVSQSVVTNPQSIDYINRQFIIGGDEGLFATSDVADGDTYNALNYAEAEASPDSLLRVFVFKQMCYMFGLHSTEVWYNSGNGNPPFDRQDTSLIDIGTQARFSIDASKQYMYWLGDDNHIYQAVGASARAISTPSLHSEISAFCTVSDAIGQAATVEGHTFYFLTFPTESKTYFYDEALNYWGTLSYGVFGARDIMNGLVFAYRKLLISDYRNGNVYEFDKDTFTDNGDTILRKRVTLPVEANGRDIIVRKLELIAQKGVGLATGQGSDPMVMLEISRDRGHTWESLEWESLGEMGDYERSITWSGLGRAKSFTFAIKYTDPTAFSLYRLVAQVDYGR